MNMEKCEACGSVGEHWGFVCVSGSFVRPVYLGCPSCGAMPSYGSGWITKIDTDADSGGVVEI